MGGSTLGNVVCLDDGSALDLLSPLCDDLLLKILNYLSLKEAGRTHGLSRRWRHLWSFRKNLDLLVDKGSTSTYVSASAEVVDKIVAYYKGAKIDTFFLSINDYVATNAQIDSWIRFAIDRDVESIELTMCQPKKPYKVTPEIFRGKFLNILYLHNCSLPVIGSVCLSSLTDCSLTQADFSRDFIAKFTSGCPVLKKMNVCRCNRYSNIRIRIKNPSMQILHVRDSFSCDNGIDGMFELFAPNILYFKLKGTLRRKYTIKISSRVEAEVDAAECSKTDVLKELFGSLSCEKLLLSRWCIQVLSLRVYTETFPTLRVRYLVLNLPLLKCEVLGLLYLLQISPNLESLTINFGFWDEGVNEESFLWSSTMDKCLLDYMIINFWDSEKDEADFDTESYNGEGNPWVSMGSFLSGKLGKLRKIELNNFFGLGFLGATNINSIISNETYTAICFRHIHLVKMLLNHSPMLEDMLIHFPSYMIPPCPRYFTYDSGERVTALRSSVTKFIQLCPRASAEAKLYFS